eukprot:XP_016880059.1 transmembrane protein 95 isoform X5 [Homo sapiens]
MWGLPRLLGLCLSSLSPRLPGQHHAVQLLHLQGDGGVLLAPKALLPRKSGSLGSQDSAPLHLRSFPASGCSEPPGGVPPPPSKKWLVKTLKTSQPPALRGMHSQLPHPLEGNQSAP